MEEQKCFNMTNILENKMINKLEKTINNSNSINKSNEKNVKSKSIETDVKTNVQLNFRSISFHNSQDKSKILNKNGARTKSFLRDSKLIDLDLPNIQRNQTKKGLCVFSYRDPDDSNSIIFESKYNFIDYYLNFYNFGSTAATSDYSIDQLAKTNFPDIFKFDFQVYVRCFNMKGDQFNLFNFVTYKLDGFYDNREFNVERRYKEFILFRKYLSNNWPGVFIPPIPPKKAFGNMEEGFIKLRKKFLQNFLNKIASAPHLAASDETRIFLDPATTNFLDINGEKFEKSYETINLFYSDYFSFLQNCDITSEQKKYIDEFLLVLKRSKETLENFLLITTEAQNNKLEFDMEIESLYENLYELDNNYIYDIYKVNKDDRIEYNKDVVECGIIENMYRTKFQDFFNCFYEWSNVELIETEAMIDAILSLKKVKENSEMRLYQFKTEEAYLNKISNPKWYNKILFSPDYELIKQQNEKVENLRKQKDSLNNLLDLTYKILYYLEIPIFKTERVDFYGKFIRLLFNCDSQENDKSQSIYKHLMSHCLNILKLYNEHIIYRKEKKNN